MAYRSDNIYALLFDLGNVVFRFDWQGAFERWAAGSGGEAARFVERLQSDQVYERHERGEIPDEELAEHVQSILGTALPFEDFIAGWGNIYLDFIPEAAMRLPALAARLPLYAFTNTNAAHLPFWSAKYEAELRSFRRIFCSHQIGMRKPEERAFLHVCREIGFAPGEVLFFDDRAEHVAGAKRAGLPGVQVRGWADVERGLREFGVEREAAQARREL
jgi:glucose-1-phosphatase